MTHLIPTFRYKDAPAAIEFLCRAFGFETKVVHHFEDGSVANAQLLFRENMIMLSSLREGEFDRHIKIPMDLDGINTQSPYLILEAEAIAAHYQKAVDAGVEVVLALKAQDYGGKGYSCKDPEGYLWNFGTYNPWTV